jgi:excinuclease ABC subunit C
VASPGSPAALRDRVVGEVSSRPGVYTWLGRDGEVLYVGKSVNLRRRMLGYLTPGAAASRSRLLVSALADFRWEETAGELLALLLEDALIKSQQPRHNTRQRDFLERRFLLLTDDAYPTCLIAEQHSGRSGELFGPFKDEYFVAELIALITEEFGLRACHDRRPFRRSARYDLGTCTGPCRGAISEAEYAPFAGRVRAFLSGDAEWITARLTAAMGEAAAEARFELAQVVKERIAFCVRFAARQIFLDQFRSAMTTVSEPSSGLEYAFCRGALVELRSREGGLLPVPDALGEPVEDPRVLLDRANVVYSWTRRERGVGSQTGS